MYIHVHVIVLMRDEKERRKKQAEEARSNKQHVHVHLYIVYSNVIRLGDYKLEYHWFFQVLSPWLCLVLCIYSTCEHNVKHIVHVHVHVYIQPTCTCMYNVHCLHARLPTWIPLWMNPRLRWSGLR